MYPFIHIWLYVVRFYAVEYRVFNVCTVEVTLYSINWLIDFWQTSDFRTNEVLVLLTILFLEVQWFFDLINNKFAHSKSYDMFTITLHRITLTLTCGLRILCTHRDIVQGAGWTWALGKKHVVLQSNELLVDALKRIEVHENTLVTDLNLFKKKLC